MRTALLQARGEASQARREVVELSSTIDAQRGTIAKQEQTILELLAALRGKRRERIDPDQLLLFEIGELETLLEEQASDPPRRRKRRGHGRRLLPDNLPQVEPSSLALTSLGLLGPRAPRRVGPRPAD